MLIVFFISLILVIRYTNQIVRSIAFDDDTGELSTGLLFTFSMISLGISIISIEFKLNLPVFFVGLAVYFVIGIIGGMINAAVQIKFGVEYVTNTFKELNSSLKDYDLDVYTYMLQNKIYTIPLVYATCNYDDKKNIKLDTGIDKQELSNSLIEWTLFWPNQLISIVFVYIKNVWNYVLDRISIYFSNALMNKDDQNDI